MAMTPNRPYLIRAFYDWIVDNDCTPHLVVDAFAPGVEVPENYVTDGQIVLNLAPRSVRHFEMNNEEIVFSTRFGGLPTDIRVPIPAVLAIYARENGQGMVFQTGGQEPPDGPDQPIGPGPGKAPGKESGKGTPSGAERKLRIVK